MFSLTIDSSVFLANYNASDVFYQAARTFFQSLSPTGSIIIPAIVPLEVGNALQRYKVDFDPEELLENFGRLRVVTVDLALISECLPIMKKMHLKTADALIVATAVLFDTTIISLDKQLLKEANHLIKAFTPTEYLAL